MELHLFGLPWLLTLILLGLTKLALFVVRGKALLAGVLAWEYPLLRLVFQTTHGVIADFIGLERGLAGLL